MAKKNSHDNFFNSKKIKRVKMMSAKINVMITAHIAHNCSHLLAKIPSLKKGEKREGGLRKS